MCVCVCGCMHVDGQLLAICWECQPNNTGQAGTTSNVVLQKRRKKKLFIRIRLVHAPCVSVRIIIIFFCSIHHIIHINTYIRVYFLNIYYVRLSYRTILFYRSHSYTKLTYRKMKFDQKNNNNNLMFSFFGWHFCAVVLLLCSVVVVVVIVIIIGSMGRDMYDV